MSLLTSAAGLAIGNPIPALLGGFKRLWGLLGAIAANINAQGWLGLAVSLLLFVHFGGEARHWRKVTVRQATLLAVANRSVSNLRTASYEAADRNRSTVDRDTAARAQVTKETHDAYQAQLARLRADPAFGVRSRSATGEGRAGGHGLSAVSPADPGDAAAPVPFPPDELLLAAETELELNALIEWVERQHAIDPNKP